MTMLTVLKRSTAVAALAALPLALAPASAAAQSETEQNQTGQSGTDQTGSDAQQTQGGLTSSDKEVDSSQEATAPDSATVIKKDGEYVETSDAQAGQQSGTQQGDQATQAGQDTGTQAAGQGGQQTGGQDTQTSQQKGQQSAQQGKAGEDQDMVVAKVGEREIHRSDVLMAIGMLPPQLQQQPPEMLIPIALDQLVMRELILQKAQEAGLDKDPAVTSLAEDASQRAKEDAMVRVWLDEELGNAVTDEKVEQTYDAVKQQLGGQAPSMQVLRPQIEQELRQQAFVDLSRDLQSGAEVTLFGPDGQPMSQ